MFYDGDVLIFARHDLATEFYFRRFEANCVFRRETPTQVLCEEKLPVSLRVNKILINHIMRLSCHEALSNPNMLP